MAETDAKPIDNSTGVGIQEQTATKSLDNLTFRKLLLNIDRNLLERDILALKYLCLDKCIGLRHGELEKVNRGLDLLDKLEKRGLLSANKLELIFELLGLIDRFDLQHQVGQYLSLLQKMNVKLVKTISPYRCMTLDFASDIGKREMESLKPVLKTYMSARTVEKMNDPIKLMIELEKLVIISPTKVEFLDQIANYLDKDGLLRKTQQFKASSTFQETSKEQVTNESELNSYTSSGNKMSQVDDSFKSLEINEPPPGQYNSGSIQDDYVSHVADSLRSSEWKMLGFALGLTSMDMDGVSDAQGMLLKWQEKTKPDERREKLCQGLRSKRVKRGDIAILLEKDGGRRGNMGGNTIVGNINVVSHYGSGNFHQGAGGSFKGNFGGAGSNFNQGGSTMGGGNFGGGAATGSGGNINCGGFDNFGQNYQGSQSGLGPVKGDQQYTNRGGGPYNTGFNDSGTQSMQESSNETVYQRQEEKKVVFSINTEGPGLNARYRMTSFPRGICLIINNMHFSGGLKERKGSEVDEENLKFIFDFLGFQVYVKRNASTVEMKRLIEDVSRMNHEKYDCFVCCILSHGGLGTLFGSDGGSCKIIELTSQFRPQYCPTLASKPKLFFLQACQGSRKAEDFDHHLEMDAAEPATENIPDDADFLLGYATAPGNVSFRSKTLGSWYVTKLTEALRKYHNTEHILDILTDVNNEVSKAIAKESDNKYKQVPAPQFTLRKKLFLTKL